MARAMGGSGADVFQAGYAVTAIPARFALERRAWKEAAALEVPGGNLTWDRFPYALASTPFARAIGVRAPPEVAPEIWETLKKSRRMRAAVIRGAPANAVLVRGPILTRKCNAREATIGKNG